MPINILYLNINSNLVGAERRLLAEVACLDKTSFRPVVGLLYKGPLTEELEKAGIEYVIFPRSKYLLQLSKERFHLKNLLHLPTALAEAILLLGNVAASIKKTKIDMLVTYTLKFHLLSVFLKPFVPCVIWQCCDLLPENNFLKKWTLSAAKNVPVRIITNSEYVRKQLIKNGVDETKVYAVHDGFLPKDFSYDEEERRKWRHELSIAPEDFAVGCIGALVEWKGQEYLIRAAKLLIGRIPLLKVMIVGDCPYDTGTESTRKRLEDLVRHLGLEDTVLFTGFVNDIGKIFCALDVVVHTSIRPEPFGRVIVEAMLWRKPVVAVGEGGVLEILRGEVNGLLTPPKDPQALAVSILDLYNNTAKRKELANMGKETSERFSAKGQSNLVGQLYLDTFSRL